MSDGSGIVRGTYSYVDPRQQIRTVEYVADKSGFYPILSHPVVAPQQSEAVRKATEKHQRLFNEIAEQHATGGHGGVSNFQIIFDQSSWNRNRGNYKKLKKSTMTILLPISIWLEKCSFKSLSFCQFCFSFQVILSPSDTKAVAYAKQKHLNAFERIAAEHARIAEERRAAEELTKDSKIEEHF